jgi:hypothetical protein
MNTPTASPRQSLRKIARRLYLESLESRTLLSSTLFVSPNPTDSTHFQTLQSALAIALPGDTIILQSGFSLGTFNLTSLAAPVNAGDIAIHTFLPLEVGQVITIGTTSSSDPAERALVTAVTPNGSGGFLITLANGLQFPHLTSPVNANNSSSTGKTIAINTAITLTAEPGVILPFNIAIWKNTSGVTLSNLNLTTSPGTSLFLEAGAHHNTLLNITAANQILLDNASNNTLTNITVGNRLYIDEGSWGNLITDSNLNQLTLRPGSHHNSFTTSTIGAVASTANNLTTSGYDTFNQNTFTAPVKITGTLFAPTADTFIGNTFSVTTGDALTLIRAAGTTITGNTFTVSKDYARAIVITDSAAITISNNQISTTGLMGTAIVATADLAATSLDITGNTLTTTDGIGINLIKYSTTANLEARVQSNDFRINAIGFRATGDGTSAGNIDLGGGSTSFGTSLGNNDFRSFTSATLINYAIGLTNTSSTQTLLAQSNLFAVAHPLLVVTDSTHNIPAGGTGIILATAAVPPPPPFVRNVSLTAPNTMSTQKGTTFTGPVATITDNLTTTTTADYTITIQWSDGQSTPATLTENSDGSYTIHTTRTFSTVGNLTATITLTTADNTLTTSTAQSWSITNKNDKIPPGKKNK